MHSQHIEDRYPAPAAFTLSLLESQTRTGRIGELAETDCVWRHFLMPVHQGGVLEMKVWDTVGECCGCTGVGKQCSGNSAAVGRGSAGVYYPFVAMECQSLFRQLIAHHSRCMQSQGAASHSAPTV
eukprot:Lankesteria_metandrocarpae@DN5288_c0_g1_i17.p1